MAWQLSVGQGLVNSVTNDHCMTFEYPIEISRGLLSMTDHFSQQAMEVHGPELVSQAAIPLSAYQMVSHVHLYCFCLIHAFGCKRTSSYFADVNQCSLELLSLDLESANLPAD
jgi:hypothetical protein